MWTKRQQNNWHRKCFPFTAKQGIRYSGRQKIHKHKKEIHLNPAWCKCANCHSQEPLTKKTTNPKVVCFSCNSLKTNTCNSGRCLIYANGLKKHQVSEEAQNLPTLEHFCCLLKHVISHHQDWDSKVKRRKSW